MSSPLLTPWTARLLRRATRSDAVHGVAAVALALLAISAGRAAAHRLSPEEARRASKLLDDLELPGALPNAALARDDGVAKRLHELTGSGGTIVTFYAPWCGPCQEELTAIAAQTAGRPQRLVVVVGNEEEPAEVRRKLDNLGLTGLRYYVDSSGQLQAAGRVTALPTTFLIGPAGRVLDRVVGNSPLRLSILVSRAEGDGSPPTPDEH